MEFNAGTWCLIESDPVTYQSFFFPKNFLPQGIQWLVSILPLTALNDSLRKISFEGSHLNDCWKEIGILAIWGVIIYAFAIKFFKWE